MVSVRLDSTGQLFWPYAEQPLAVKAKGKYQMQIPCLLMGGGIGREALL